MEPRGPRAEARSQRRVPRPALDEPLDPDLVKPLTTAD